MSNPRNPALESSERSPNPENLFAALSSEELNSKEKKYGYLRRIFVDPADIDQYIAEMNANQDLDMRVKDVKALVLILDCFKYDLPKYLEKFGQRITTLRETEEPVREAAESVNHPFIKGRLMATHARITKAVRAAERVESKPRHNGKTLKGNANIANKRELSPEQTETLLKTLKARFEDPNNMRSRHQEMKWDKVQARLEARPEKLWSLNEMEQNGHEPDVVDYDGHTGEYIFFSCSAESPAGQNNSHRNIVYDRAAEEELKRQHPDAIISGNAVDIAAAMGCEILNRDQYLNKLQLKGAFDRTTWVWVLTPKETRNPIDKTKAGVALYGYRFDFGAYVFEDNPDVHYVSRGFRGSLRV